ncbi:hydroxyacid dehydrogenase [Wenjunlia vitaminophila]|uniref:Hydroxyacid dehydrogenase n=1 Tax=Wenjunlia vitaminophila TaxID=76728 RepID=A0A0T6LSQ4_WENVI|nr:hydroxyacid dehydrogenase [Wenjunlia vitaminophila]KRV49062.1 hydroxyacid dehydrogenase [Wenjunlia vitaminophila]
MSPEVAAGLFTPNAMERLAGLVELVHPAPLDDLTTPTARAALERVDVLVTGWGCPLIDDRALAAAPRLRAVVHTAGSVKGIVGAECWRRGIEVSSAVQINALPVAEYTLAVILLANKGVLDARERYRRLRGPADWHAELAGYGNYRRTVGVIGASRVGRRVLELLRPHDFQVLLADPFLADADAQALGAEPVGLDELCARSDVVSVHAPALPETRHLLDGPRLALMRDGALLVNTARGSLVDHDALTRELVSGRLRAVLDVTEPEVLPPDSPLYDLPNVLLTPHVAGSMGNELHRLADFALDELQRWCGGLPFSAPVTAAELGQQA